MRNKRRMKKLSNVHQPTLTLSPKDLPPLSRLAEDALTGGKSLGERGPATALSFSC